MVKKTEPIEETPRIDPTANTLLFNFLHENNLKLVVTALDQENPFVEGAGFVLTTKPLLVVKAEYKEAAE